MADRKYIPPEQRMVRHVFSERNHSSREEEKHGKRRVILEAAYEPDAKHLPRSPEWLVPELVDAGWTLTEDTPHSCKWAGVIDGETYARFAKGWGLENKPGEANFGEHGDLASYSYTFDGLEWESGGSSPIVWMTLTVSEPVKTDPEPIERELPCVYWG
jgi:hypothetical protein